MTLLRTEIVRVPSRTFVVLISVATMLLLHVEDNISMSLLPTLHVMGPLLNFLNSTAERYAHVHAHETLDADNDVSLSSSSADMDHHRRRLRRKPDTGSFKNCTAEHNTSRFENSTDLALWHSRPSHPESGLTVLSCRAVHYRAPLSEIETGGYSIVVGVLSGAGGKGPLHRDSIRSTWARKRKGVYFIVAGPWEDIAEEYDKYRDLIWIEEDEVYEGEQSVLPFKTQVFIDILHKYSLPGKAGFQYLFKTDDDSYLDLDFLEKTLEDGSYDYWGCCTTEHYRPLRSPTRKWRVSFEVYPEQVYPLYCQGAGFAMSREFVDCMSEHLGYFRYMPFEDVAVGLLAERCGIPPVSDFVKIQQYRTQDASEKKQVNDEKKEEIYFLPRATMKGKVLQHRVKTHYDMYAHHKCVLEGC